MGSAPEGASPGLESMPGAGASPVPAAGPGSPAAPALDWREMGPVGLLGLAWAVIPAILGGFLLYHLGTVAGWLAADPAQGLVAYALLFALTAGLGLLPTFSQAALGGWVFGLTVGLGAALVGFVLAALLGFLVARLVAGDRVRGWLDRHPRASVVREALLGAGGWRSLRTVALVRLPPNSPFALTNLALASGGVGLFPYLLGTAVGMLPRTALVAGFAAAAASSGARDVQEFVSEGPGWGVFAAGFLALVVVLSILSRMARAALERAGLGPSAGPPRG